jgi:SAM-dependent methyltransferase
MKYDYTPSFFNDEEFFNEYLGRTSYYLKLQEITKKLISICQPQVVLELGSALGTTVSMLAHSFSTIQFTGVDIREDVIKDAENKYHSIHNLKFECADMCEFVCKYAMKYDFIYMLYAFHHINDPLSNKEDFLTNCYECMKPGSYLFITETFLPSKDDEWLDVANLFKARALEGYASTYWEALRSLEKNDIELANKIATTSLKEESTAGQLVDNRDSEYLVEFSWLIELSKRIGFQVKIAEPVNCINEKAILLLR